jgi:hypothetical protein
MSNSGTQDLNLQKVENFDQQESYYGDHTGYSDDYVPDEEDFGPSNEVSKTSSSPGCDFPLAISSNLFFLLGTTLYVALAVVALDWYKYESNVPDEVLAADDDWTWSAWYNETNYTLLWDDDYVFQAVGSNPNSWVTREMMIYFSAAVCFLFTGMLDWFRNPTEWLYSIIMVIAACFGVASSMLVIQNDRLAIIFNSVSVHLFAVEAAYILFSRRAQNLRIWLFVSDAFFMLGTLLDVILSYFLVFETFRLPHAQAQIAAAVFWLACALMITLASIYLRSKGHPVLRKRA